MGPISSILFLLSLSISVSSENKEWKNLPSPSYPKGSAGETLTQNHSEFDDTGNSNHEENQTLVRPRRGTTHKSFKSSSTTVNGQTTTTMWYYNSNGPNYKFTILGGLPASRDDMIQWLENNSHKYKLTTVPYEGDADDNAPSLPPRLKPSVLSNGYRKFKSSTVTKNGETKTTIWYYNTNGPNYKFTIYGGLPVGKDDMIDWLERNSHKYRLTPVSFEGDEVEVASTTTRRPPTTTPRPPPPPTTTPSPPPPPPSPRPTSTLLWHQILPSECGTSGGTLIKAFTHNKIEGGAPVPIETNPWQVALVNSNTRALTCGGSIISKNHVLTASHCFFTTKTVKGNKFQEIVKKQERMVYAGNEHIEHPAQQFQILDLFLHSKYSSLHNRNDIALVMIQGTFTWTNRVFPICLPSTAATYSPRRSCRVSGWGKTASENISTEEKLRAAIVEIVDTNDCKRENEKEINISGGMFCAGNYEEGKVDTCQGDSGGPCTCNEDGKGTLFGITSWGIGCGRAKYPGVYCKVSMYILWIRTRLEVSVGSRSRDSLLDSEDEDVGAPSVPTKSIVKQEEKAAEEEDWDADIL